MKDPKVRKKLGKSLGWRKYNPEESLARNKTYKACRGFLRRAVKQLGFSKKSKTKEILGYTSEELRKHLESLFLPGMSWENHGFGADMWNIDHIRPVCTFEIGTDPAIVNSLSNLRPLWQNENLRRSKSLDSDSKKDRFLLI